MTFEHLDDRARPAVGDDQRQRVRVRRPDVDEVDVEAVDLGQELREGVQPRLEPAEVVVGRPVAHELLHRRERDALRQVGDGLLLGPARRLEPPAEVVDVALGATSTLNGRIASDPTAFGSWAASSVRHLVGSHGDTAGDRDRGAFFPVMRPVSTVRWCPARCKWPASRGLPAREIAAGRAYPPSGRW